MSSRPSELRDTPFSRPPLVWVCGVDHLAGEFLAVRCCARWVMALSLMLVKGRRAQNARRSEDARCGAFGPLIRCG